MKSELTKAANVLGLTVPDLGTGKVFEALAMFKIASELARHVDRVEPRHHDGTLAADFVFRLGPGHLHPPDAPGNLPCHIALVDPIPELGLEIHNSLEFVGTSETPHEIDIAIIRSTDADRLREAGGGCVPEAPLVGVELKQYLPGTALDKNFVRAFVACVIELEPLRHLDRITFGRGNDKREQARSRPEALYQFWTTAHLSGEAKKLARFYGIDAHDELKATSLALPLFHVEIHVMSWLHIWAKFFR